MVDKKHSLFKIAILLKIKMQYLKVKIIFQKQN